MGAVDIEHATQSTLNPGARHSMTIYAEKPRGPGYTFAEEAEPPSLTLSCISSLSW